MTEEMVMGYFRRRGFDVPPLNNSEAVYIDTKELMQVIEDIIYDTNSEIRIEV